MAAFFIIFLSLVCTVLGAVYAPEIRLWIRDTAKNWQSRWDNAQQMIAEDDAKAEVKDDDISNQEKKD